jgi:hypothetical protein
MRGRGGLRTSVLFSIGRMSNVEYVHNKIGRLRESCTVQRKTFACPAVACILKTFPLPDIIKIIHICKPTTIWARYYF